MCVPTGKKRKKAAKSSTKHLPVREENDVVIIHKPKAKQDPSPRTSALLLDEEPQPKLEAQPLLEIDSRSATQRCPSTQPRIHVKCKLTNRNVVGVKVTLGGEDLGLTDGSGITAPLEGGMVPGKGAAAIVLAGQQALDYQPDLDGPALIDYPKPCQDTFIVHAVCLARPKVKVVFKDNGAGVPGVTVTLADKVLDATDGSGITTWPTAEPGLLPKDYPLKMALALADTKKYRWVDTKVADSTVTVTDTDNLTFTYEVLRLGRPKIELVRQDNAAKVPDVGIKLSGGGSDADFGKTSPAGLAERPDDADWLEPREYDVAFTFNARDADRYVLVEATPKVTVAEGAEATTTFHVKPMAALLVEISRHDGTVLPGRARFFLQKVGSLAKQTLDTEDFNGKDDSDLGGTIREDRKKIVALEPGDYEVTIDDVPGLLTAQKATTEVWSISPGSGGVARVTLVAEQVKRVRFVLTKVRQIQFIAFEIEPTDKADPLNTLPSKKLYHGHADADGDIGARCIIMKNAIKKAATKAVPMTGTIKTEETILKVFMAPEFYFRGLDGAYPIEKMSHIMDEMREETSKPAYKDWLFVFGTALGYYPHETSGADITHKLVLSGAPGMAASRFTVGSGVGPDSSAKVCARIPANWDLGNLLQVPQYRWTLKQGPTTALVTKCTPGIGRYDLDVNTPVTFTDGAIELVEPAATEILNVALVQKGGPGGGVAGLREAIIYKEDISAIDFLGIMFGKHDLFHKRSGDNREAEVRGAQRRVLPTEGARDVLGGNPNLPGTGDISEVTGHGLGGGSIFTVDGITFGLEICRDHLQGRLRNYYLGDPTATPAVAATARPGEPKIQVQLIPSWGAYIKPAAIVGVDNVLVFNVDGPKGAKAGPVTGPTGYHCPLHPLVPLSPLPAKCTAGQHYKCWGMSLTPGNCPHCGVLRTQSIDTGRFTCDRTVHVLGAAVTNCNVGSCTAAAKACFSCPNPACRKLSSTGGKCTHCVPKPTKVPAKYCDVKPHIHTLAGACACGQPRQKEKKYYCTKHSHIQLTTPNCTGCVGTVQAANNYDMPAKDVVAAVAADTAPVSDHTGTYKVITATPDLTASPISSGKTTYATTSHNLTPKQSDYFKQRGKLAINPVMDIPPAETV